MENFIPFDVYARAEREILNKYHKEVRELAVKLDRTARINRVAENLAELCDVSNPNKIKCIKIIRDAFGLGLKESKDIIDAAFANVHSKNDLPF